MTSCELKILELGQQRYGSAATLEQIIEYQKQPFKSINCGNDYVNQYHKNEYNKLNKLIARR